MPFAKATSSILGGALGFGTTLGSWTFLRCSITASSWMCLIGARALVASGIGLLRLSQEQLERMFGRHDLDAPVAKDVLI